LEIAKSDEDPTKKSPDPAKESTMDSESEILTLPEQIYKEGDESISMG